MTSTRTSPTTGPALTRSGARTAYTAIIGIAAVIVLLQAVWAGLFVHEGEDYTQSWVEVHARMADVAIGLGIIAFVVLAVKLRSQRVCSSGRRCSSWHSSSRRTSVGSSATTRRSP